jgi:glycine/D-amino acid oxidase-like deaminating enzyme/nitrite reductase/ring-hydroxylating ferredoxin subunit
MPTQSRVPVDTSPYWKESSPRPSFPTLDRDAHADVVIVGGGMSGLMTAYLLVTAGKSVIVLERNRIAQADTGHTSAHLAMVTDTRLGELVKRLGGPHAQAVCDAGLAAISQIDEIAREHEIDCNFAWVDGYLHAPQGVHDEKCVREFRDEAQLASEMGFDAEFVANTPLVDGPGIRFEGQARIHPGKFLAGLAEVICASGGQIHEESAAEKFGTNPLSVKANGHTVTCDDIVLATHNPLVGNRALLAATLFQTELALYTSYVIAGHVEKGLVPDALWWDTNTPYQFLRLDPRRDHDVVIFGGEDHKTGQVSDTNACYARLEKAAHARVPGLTITHRWSGQVIETPDGLPFIGKSADHQYLSTGFCGNGLTFGTVGAMIATDAILGRTNPWSELFAPGRAALLRGLWDYVKENADYPYYLIRGRFAGAEGRSLRSVARGHGKVIERNGHKIAAYRNESGATTLRSAICTHMGCVVAWNTAERTWDCPCHGSRFTPHGEVISGPAESPLPEIES